MEKRYERALALFYSGSDAEESGDLESAIRLFKSAARLGMGSAYLSLGNIYDDVVKPAQPSKAVASYKRACALGNPSGAYNLSAHYKNIGNSRWARFWKIRADAMGHSDD